MELVKCPHCNCDVQSKRLSSHILRKCPKSPDAPSRKKNLAYTGGKVASAKNKKAILIRSRLERLLKDLESKNRQPDDEELAKVFKSFYYMYVWKGNEAAAPAVQIVSGGLPSLGKNAK